MGRKTYPANSRNAFTYVNLGIPVDRADSAIPQTTSTNYFQIIGGRVILTCLIGQVGTALGATATNMKWTSTPASCTASDICANVAVASTAANAFYTITGIAGDAAIIGTGACRTMSTTGIIIPTGYLTCTTSASDTGTMKWTVCYHPFDDGAYVISL